MKKMTLKEIKFSKLKESTKLLYLELLGYEVDEKGFITKDKKRIKCDYTKEFVPFKTASILPGSTVIMNTSPYTLSSYISDHLEGEEEGLQNGSNPRS